jgi:hypothetical protein
VRCGALIGGHEERALTSPGSDRAHLYCSVFQPATYYSDPAEMKLAEGVHLAETSAWTTVRVGSQLFGRLGLCGRRQLT